ncbi:uncharacterized protein LOC27206192 [Drosophila simulans]|uniref:Receptor expression-enhancing protein n=1 Tax=Drosophila simulans TaxID=7240 RepID=A0A0J9RKY0_DROSI|nr:uncharacterized protein LOC27206192 [Drosophila simulans]KMY96114.1 uncharacterized protein Dsimw501_GD11796 [Drosophila simulans]
MLRLVYIYYGTLLPGWSSLRAFGQGQRHFSELWLKYWVIYALLQGLGVLTDFLLSGFSFYAGLKLILSVGLWFSAPYSTNHLFNLLDAYAMGKLGAVVENGVRWHGQISRNIFRGFMQSPLVTVIMPRGEDEHITEPRINKRLLKRELSNLMTQIARETADHRHQQERPMMRHSPRHLRAAEPDKLNGDSMHNVVEYFDQRWGDQQ